MFCGAVGVLILKPVPLSLDAVVPGCFSTEKFMLNQIARDNQSPIEKYFSASIRDPQPFFLNVAKETASLGPAIRVMAASDVLMVLVSSKTTSLKHVMQQALTFNIRRVVVVQCETEVSEFNSPPPVVVSETTSIFVAQCPFNPLEKLEKNSMTATANSMLCSTIVDLKGQLLCKTAPLFPATQAEAKALANSCPLRIQVIGAIRSSKELIGVVRSGAVTYETGVSNDYRLCQQSALVTTIRPLDHCPMAQKYAASSRLPGVALTGARIVFRVSRIDARRLPIPSLISNTAGIEGVKVAVALRVSWVPTTPSMQIAQSAITVYSCGCTFNGYAPCLPVANEANGKISILILHSDGMAVDRQVGVVLEQQNVSFHAEIDDAWELCRVHEVCREGLTPAALDYLNAYAMFALPIQRSIPEALRSEFCDGAVGVDLGLSLKARPEILPGYNTLLHFLAVHRARIPPPTLSLLLGHLKRNTPLQSPLFGSVDLVKHSIEPLLDLGIELLPLSLIRETASDLFISIINQKRRRAFCYLIRDTQARIINSTWLALVECKDTFPLCPAIINRLLTHPSLQVDFKVHEITKKQFCLPGAAELLQNWTRLIPGLGSLKPSEAAVVFFVLQYAHKTFSFHLVLRICTFLAPDFSKPC